MKYYKIFLSANDKFLKDKAKIIINILGNIKIKDIEELKYFKILYVSKGHDDFINIKGEYIQRKVRYVQIFKK